MTSTISIRLLRSSIASLLKEKLIFRSKNIVLCFYSQKMSDFLYFFCYFFKFFSLPFRKTVNIWLLLLHRRSYEQSPHHGAASLFFHEKPPILHLVPYFQLRGTNRSVYTLRAYLSVIPAIWSFTASATPSSLTILSISSGSLSGFFRK